MELTDPFFVSDWENQSLSQSWSNGRPRCLSKKSVRRISQHHSKEIPLTFLSKKFHLVAGISHLPSNNVPRYKLAFCYSLVLYVCILNRLNVL